MLASLKRKGFVAALLVTNVFAIAVFLNYRQRDYSYRPPIPVSPPCPTPGSETDPLHEVPGSEDGPSLEHEVSWRRARQTSRQAWLHIRYALDQMRNQVKESVALKRPMPNLTASIEGLLQSAADYHRALRTDLQALSETDGREEWKTREAKRLGQLAQKMLHDNQNPKDCRSARLLVFEVPFVGCGFGCRVHHIVFSLTLALKLRRTLVLKSKGMPGAPGGWSDLFRPLSEACPDVPPNSTISPWGTLDEIRGSRVVRLGVWVTFTPQNKPPHSAFDIPPSLASHVTLVHGDPSVWWLGQVASYIMRPSRDLDKLIDDRKRSLGFQHPVVGVQVRRTDKVGGGEGKFHGLSQYMQHVKEHYDWLESRGHVTKRRVFLATDDKKVLTEMTNTFPGYEFIYDATNIDMASVKSRWNKPKASLQGIVVDITLLSQCDLIVCTMSSNVCRRAYELMQTLHSDASGLFRSVDADFFFYYDHRTLLAIADHTPPANATDPLGGGVGVAKQNRPPPGGWHEVAFKKGDKLTYPKQDLGDDGWLIATNTRTRQSGLVPAHKVEFEVPVMEIDK